jgi:hypothetical protein
MWIVFDIIISTIFDIIISIVYDMCSWRVWLSIGIAVGIVVGLYCMFPAHGGLWSISYPAAMMVIAMGFWWQNRADRS